MGSFDYDVVVIGSGFGGSVAALRAAEKGYRVGVMESGRRWKDPDIPKTQWNLPHFLWLPAEELYGIQRIEYLDDVLILSGAGVGGGSHIYANTLYVPPKQFFDAPGWAGITDWADELAPCFDQATRMFGVVRYPYMPTDVDRYLQRVATEMGRAETFNKAPVGVYFGSPGVEADDPYFGGAARAFVRVNCAAIPQSLIASELFGHEKGAFTGALQRRLGRFEIADGGTLFLDEIGELPMETQISLLRVLQEREFERVGSNHPISIDVRLIAATNRDLSAAVAAGTFRQDLFYRLNVFPIAVPPLRERPEDIPLLVEYFVGRFAKDTGKNIRRIGKDTLEQLRAYDWPGNIRELQNVIERAVILSESDTFAVDLSWLGQGSAEPARPHEGFSALADREVEMIRAALAESHGRISGPSGAAAKLGIPRQTLESKIKRLGIDKYGQERPRST